MPAPKGNKNAVGNRGGGGVCKYRPKYAQMASKACAAGFTDRELAELFGVGESTINKWKLDHVEFAGALKRGKFPADERVERSLFQRAIGYTYDTVKILKPAGTTEPVIVPYRQHVPPDVTACIFWLKNRRPDEWRDRQEQRHMVVQDNRTAAEILADLQRQMAEMGLDLVPRDDSSFALPPVLPATGVTPAGNNRHKAYQLSKEQRELHEDNNRRNDCKTPIPRSGLASQEDEPQSSRRNE